jgi:hypothetical protein
MSNNTLLLILVAYSIVGSIYNFFKSIGNGIDYGFTTLYNDTVGKLTGAFGNFTLSSAESLVIDAEAAVLSFMAVGSNYIGNVVGGVFNDIIGVALAPSLGIFGPMIAFLLIVAIFVAIIIGVRLLIDIA